MLANSLTEKPSFNTTDLTNNTSPFVSNANKKIYTYKPKSTPKAPPPKSYSIGYLSPEADYYIKIKIKTFPSIDPLIFIVIVIIKYKI